MEATYEAEAVELLEKANASLEPELLSIPEAKRQLEVYARARRLVDFGIAALAGKLDDAAKLAQVTGTSIGRARDTVSTGKILGGSQDVRLAMGGGGISLDKGQRDRPDRGRLTRGGQELLKVAGKEPFHRSGTRPGVFYEGKDPVTSSAGKVRAGRDQGCPRTAAGIRRGHLHRAGKLKPQDP